MSAGYWKSHSQTAGVLALLNTISASEKFSQAVEGPPLGSAWVPPPPIEFDEKAESPEIHKFVKGLRIPNVGNLTFPAMPLYRLGTFINEAELRMRKEDIFSGNNTFLVNVSGSGKTRLLFEGLCDNWGLYFTSYVDSSFLGSFDVQAIVGERPARQPGFVSRPPPEDAQAFALNMRFARSRSSRVLLSRLLVFKAFLDHAATSGGVSQEQQKLWLHFQLWPNVRGKDEEWTEHLADVFTDLYEALLDAEVDDAIVDDAIAQTATEILTVLGEPARVFIALDEANVAANKCEQAFRDEDGNYYPLLKAILKAWQEHLKDLPFVFVVAGTEIPSQHFVNDNEWASSVWCSNTGGFDDQECQRRYVQQFLPNELWESIGDLLTQHLMLTSVRHRFTAAYLAVLLEHSYAKPLSYLDMFIEKGTGLLPLDVHYDIPLPCDILPYDRLDFTTMEIDRKLRSYVHLALMDAFLSLTNPGYSISAIKLVNEGMGRFTDTRCSHIVVDEPLVIARAVTWFSGDEEDIWFHGDKRETPASILNYQYFIDHLVDPGMAPRHPPAYLAFALALVFSRSRRVSDILALSKPVPIWSRRNANIMVLKQVGDGVMESPVRRVDRIHRTLVTYSTTLADTLSWMRHHHRTPFCIHVTETTATLIFIVKLSNNTRFWAIMRVLHSLADEDVATKIRDTAHDLQAENLFREPANILDALDSLPSICSQVCPHGILPVIAVLKKDIEDIKPGVLNGSDSSRVALVRLDELSQALDLFPQEQIVERIINAITKDPEKAEEEAKKEVEETTTWTKVHAGKARVSASNQSKFRRPRGSGIVQRDMQASGPSHATALGTSRYNLRPRKKCKTR
uniref:Uncharacterized protein n=1 Tax=Moniliophthora roreri TaxID=221103 RepID=A0A0W0G577_MONRR